MSDIISNESITATEDWKSTLADDLKSSESLAKFKDIGSLANSYIHLEKKIGSSVSLPTETSTPEDLQKFYEKVGTVKGLMKAPDINNPEDVSKVYGMLGRPENPDNYKLEIDENLVDADIVKDFKNQAHALGLNSKQLQEVINYQIKLDNMQIEQYNKRVDENTNLLKQQWGDTYEDKLNGAKAALERYASKYNTDVKSIGDSANGFSPALIEALADLNSSLKSSPSLKGGSIVSSSTSPEEVRAKITEKRMSPDFNSVYNNAAHPQYKDLHAEMDSLYKQLAASRQGHN